MGRLSWEYVREISVVVACGSLGHMPECILDVRDVPPSDRHPKIHAAFGELPSGGALWVINDHEPKPLAYELQA